MRIGIDARLLGGQFTGDRTYWRGLLSGLAAIDGENQYFLYMREPFAEAPLALPANFHSKIVPGASDRRWSFVDLPDAAKRDRVDVMHVQYTVSPFFSMPVVTTIHDITFKLFPELFTSKDRILLNLTVPLAIKKARRVIAVSESTKRDILRAYPGTPTSKVVSTPLAAGPEFRPLEAHEKESANDMLNHRYGIGNEPFVLAVGVLQPRKNLAMLLHAFRVARFLAKLPHKLVITGKKGWMSAEIEAAIGNASSDEVLFTGYVPDDHLPLLYGCADLMCYPSLYEGFGLPPLEAMACGCPVLVSNTSSLPEVVGTAGVFADPKNPGAWIDALSSILTDRAKLGNLSKSGMAQASKFSWNKTAALTLDVYRSCHNG